MKTVRHVTPCCGRSQDSEKTCQRKTFLLSHSRSSSRSDDRTEWKPDTKTGYFSRHSDTRRVGCSDCITCSVLTIYSTRVEMGPVMNSAAFNNQGSSLSLRCLGPPSPAAALRVAGGVLK